MASWPSPTQMKCRRQSASRSPNLPRTRMAETLNTPRICMCSFPCSQWTTYQNPNDAMPCPNGGRPGELCGPALGTTLISLFGFVPEAWKTHPAVSTQCPDPNNPVPGTCTMHASSVDLSVTLNALGKTGPPTAPVFVPTPNHDHVIDNSRVNATPIWWEVRPVLILDQSDWPAADGSSGITSSKAMDDAEAAGRAIEVGSNFFLFFSSKLDSMSGMTSK